MKIDRRSFLAFGIGGTAGTMLSPLPWKLTDDFSIWSQNWPWTPVPQKGEITYVNSTCTLCSGGCGITVRKAADRVVKIEGMKGSPINDGGICILGLAGAQLLYSPNRITAPLKRKGKRREGRWEKITWNQAISEIVKNLKELRSKDQAYTVGCISGGTLGTVPKLLNRFLKAYGSPNFMSTTNIQDSYNLTLDIMQGTKDTIGFDLENTDLVLSFGSGIIEGWGSPVRMFRANSQWQGGNGKMIQIEPRLSTTAAKADQWIPIKPGTEVTLALGLCHVIIQESLYHNDFINNFSHGFEDWVDDKGDNQKGFKQSVLDSFSPEVVSKITGVDASSITSLAREFAGSKKPLALCGYGQGNTAGNMSILMAVHALNALVGNVEKQGGVWTVPVTDHVNWPEPQMDNIASNGSQIERIDGFFLNGLPDVLNAEKGYPLQTLFVHNSNPCYTLPNCSEFNKSLEKVPFLVSFSSYMDETAQMADLILPQHTNLERFEDITTPRGFQKPFIGLSRPVVEPVFDTKHTGDVIIEIAKKLGGTIENAFPWETYETCLEETLNDKWEVLNEKGYWIDSDYKPPTWDSAFKTDSGKFEFIKKELDSKLQFGQIEIEGDEPSYPLILIYYDSMRIANGPIGDPPFLMKTISDTVLKGNDCYIQINPETAKSYGFLEGDKVMIATPKGTAKVLINLYDGIMPGIVAIPKGLGHTAYDNYLAGKGVNFNELIGPVEDPISGLDAVWGIRAKLTKA